MSSVSSRIGEALQAATAAPSLFNSQPWRLRTAGRTVLICADRTRRLPIHDPADRELLIACGAYTLYAQVALRARGLDSHTEHLPDPSLAPDIVAVLQISTDRAEPDREAQRLDAVMDRTQFDRRPFTSAAVPAATEGALACAAEAEGAWLRVLDEDRRIEAAVLHTHADEELRLNEQAVAELAHWTRDSDSFSDGVAAHDLDDIGRLRACSLKPREFNPELPPGATQSEPPEPERPLLAVLCTARDSPVDAVVAGRALGRVLLEAAAMGLSTSPLNQTLQSAGRWRLPSALSLTGIPQYQLRVGIAAENPPAPHRRPLSDLLTSACGLEISTVRPPSGPGQKESA